MIRPDAVATAMTGLSDAFHASLPPLALIFLAWRSECEWTVGRSSNELAILAVFAWPAFAYVIHRLRMPPPPKFGANTDSHTTAIRRGRSTSDPSWRKKGDGSAARRMPPMPRSDCLTSMSPDGSHLPSDAFVRVCEYLHPRDATTLACCNQSARDMIDGGTAPSSDDSGDGVSVGSESSDANGGAAGASTSTADLLWKALWCRDYSAVILGWDVGREAIARSLLDSSSERNVGGTDQVEPDESATLLLERVWRTVLSAPRGGCRSRAKRFYFEFSEAYLDYVLAGQNTSERCLLGLHGHVVDFTNFLPHHPGLTDDVAIHCGGDATERFEDVPHSAVARLIASGHCITVDLRCCGHARRTDERVDKDSEDEATLRGQWGAFGTTAECGLYRIPQSIVWSDRSGDSNTRPPRLPKRDTTGKKDAIRRLRDRLIPKRTSKPRRPNTLDATRRHFDVFMVLCGGKSASWTASFENASEEGNGGMRGDQRIYYDPLQRKWCGWYTNSDFRPVFLGGLDDLSKCWHAEFKR